MDKKTSLLQKNILTTIYSQGEYLDRVAVVELNPDKVDINYQLKKLKLIKERGGKLESEAIEGGLNIQYFRVQSFQLKRSKLACFLFNWHEFNVYLDLVNEARLKSRPSNYSARQVALSNSLKSLELKGYVTLKDIYEDELSKSERKQAKVISLTTGGIKKAESILTIKLKNSKK